MALITSGGVPFSYTNPWANAKHMLMPGVPNAKCPAMADEAGVAQVSHGLYGWEAPGVNALSSTGWGNHFQ